METMSYKIDYKNEKVNITVYDKKDEMIKVYELPFFIVKEIAKEITLRGFTPKKKVKKIGYCSKCGKHSEIVIKYETEEGFVRELCKKCV